MSVDSKIEVPETYGEHSNNKGQDNLSCECLAKAQSVKQVIAMRKDLKVRKGKLIAQGAHASLAVLLDMMRNNCPREEYEPKISDGQYIMPLTVQENSALDQWLRGRFTKICLAVDTEQEMLALYCKAKEANLPASLIIDAGLTEFHGVPTNTCIAIGPASSDEIDKITGHLNLL